jgi:copper resistance protein C
MKTFTRAFAILLGVLTLLIGGQAMAHVALDHAAPKVGAEIDTSPTEVKIWFDGSVEASFSGIEVLDADGKRVDKKDCHVDPKDSTLLIVSVPPLAAGTYKVVWHAVASDTHKTQGDFKFTVKAAAK